MTFIVQIAGELLSSLVLRGEKAAKQMALSEMTRMLSKHVSEYLGRPGEYVAVYFPGAPVASY